MIGNYVSCRITGRECLRFIHLCQLHHCQLFQLSARDDTYVFTISANELKMIRPLIHKTHIHLHIINRRGPAFLLYKHRGRLFFCAGLALMALSVWFSSFFVWHIQITGMKYYTASVLLRALDSMDVRIGMLKSQLSPTAIEDELRIQFPGITWVSASTKGTVLQINLVEANQQTFQTDTTQNERTLPTNLIAASDTVITAITVSRGTPLCHIGDSVKKGDILVEGKVFVYNEDETLKKVDYVVSEAQIEGEYTLHYKETYKNTYMSKVYSKINYQRFRFIFGSQSLILPTLHQPDAPYETWISRIDFKLNESFYLPFAIETTTMYPYTLKPAVYTKETLQTLVQSDLTNYLNEMMKKGVQIIRNSVKIKSSNNGMTAEGDLILNGPVSVTQTIKVTDMAINNNQTEEQTTE